MPAPDQGSEAFRQLLAADHGREERLWHMQWLTLVIAGSLVLVVRVLGAWL